MTRRRLILLLALLTFVSLPEVFSQQRDVLMAFTIRPGGDTLFLDNLNPVWIFPKGRKGKKDLKEYYRLVYNFNKVYPFARVARDIVNEADSELDRISSKRKHGWKRQRFVNNMQDELFDVFEKPLKNMTYSQGKLLVRLIDREIGKSSYDIIRDYKSGVAAGFWQGVAKLFDNNLKKRYDPSGEDAVTEYLVQQWELGYFPSLYYSIFYEMPPQVKVPERKSK